MTESEYLSKANELFVFLEDQIDELDIDIQVNEDVFIIECDDEQIYINKHIATKEIWVSAKRSAHHFYYDNNTWLRTVDNLDFFEFISGILTQLLDEDILIKKI